MFKILFKHKLGEVAINTFFKNLQTTFTQKPIDPSKIKVGDRFYKISSVYRHSDGDTNICEVYDVVVDSIMDNTNIIANVSNGKLIQKRKKVTTSKLIDKPNKVSIYAPGIYELIPMDASE